MAGELVGGLDIIKELLEAYPAAKIGKAQVELDSFKEI